LGRRKLIYLISIVDEELVYLMSSVVEGVEG
jgi:hypothetical protein